MPFLDALQRDIHFAKHGREFGAADAMEYERMADAFMFDPITADIGECTRRNGRDRLRFGYTSHHFEWLALVLYFLEPSISSVQ